MKTTGVFSALLLGTALVLGTPANVDAQDARQNFALINKTGFDIKEVYVSPHRSNDWEENVLAQEILEDNQRFNIRFNRRTRTCRWDLKVVYDIDDSDAVWKNIDLCSISTVTIYYNKKNDKTTAEFD